MADVVSTPESLPAPPDAEALRAFTDDAARENLRRRLDYVKDLQASVRNRAGRIKKAKFKAAVLALRWEKFTIAQTADILGETVGAVESALRSLRDAAELDDHIKTIDHEILPIAVDNLARAVLDGNVGVSERIARGRGLLRTFKQVESSITKRTMKLTIDVKMTAPDGSLLSNVVRAGTIVGAAANPTEFDETVGAALEAKK
jgi:hypothetical protein